MMAELAAEEEQSQSDEIEKPQLKKVPKSKEPTEQKAVRTSTRHKQVKKPTEDSEEEEDVSESSDFDDYDGKKKKQKKGKDRSKSRSDSKVKKPKKNKV